MGNSSNSPPVRKFKEKFNPTIFDELGKAKSDDGKVKTSEWYMSIEYKGNEGKPEELGKRKMRPNVETKALDIFTLKDNNTPEFSISEWIDEGIESYKAPKNDLKRKLRVPIWVTRSSPENNIHKLILHCKDKLDADFWIEQLN